MLAPEDMNECIKYKTRDYGGMEESHQKGRDLVITLCLAAC